MSESVDILLSFSCQPCSKEDSQQSASGPLASVLLSVPVGSHQSLDPPWVLALSANYTVYLATAAAVAKQISLTYHSGLIYYTVGDTKVQEMESSLSSSCGHIKRPPPGRVLTGSPHDELPGHSEGS
ncbi:unnamed protein product [Pleuronectes platessa]|uniref:Uncharacterized protein n=1 Tax=Pleuronectes platessa TaxID=8262 RepID=A0A9N7UCM9_PLEPL|nr:unnamed protein product [Pleuronectes platessa]